MLQTRCLCAAAAMQCERGRRAAAQPGPYLGSDDVLLCGSLGLAGSLQAGSQVGGHQVLEVLQGGVVRQAAPQQHDGQLLRGRQGHAGVGLAVVVQHQQHGLHPASPMRSAECAAPRAPGWQRLQQELRYHMQQGMCASRGRCRDWNTFALIAT